MRRRVLVLTIAAAISQANPPVWGETPTESRTPVAHLFSKPIYAEELEPSPQELQAFKGQRSVEELRQQGLNTRILGALQTHFCATHPCEPSEEEIQSFLQATHPSRTLEQFDAQKASLAQQLESPDASEEQKAKLREELKQVEQAEQLVQGTFAAGSPEQQAQLDASMREVARGFVGTWKFHKALYAAYGGTVIWQQAGVEPVGAYRAWLEELERNGSFQIYDPNFRTQFWEYFVRPHPFTLDDEQARHVFDVPWWLNQTHATER